jgi:hypothetical protein
VNRAAVAWFAQCDGGDLGDVSRVDGRHRDTHDGDDLTEVTVHHEVGRGQQEHRLGPVEAGSAKLLASCQ